MNNNKIIWIDSKVVKKEIINPHNKDIGFTNQKAQIIGLYKRKKNYLNFHKKLIQAKAKK
jgi:hypothetical protein